MSWLVYHRRGFLSLWLFFLFLVKKNFNEAKFQLRWLDRVSKVSSWSAWLATKCAGCVVGLKVVPLVD
jgi:hypothetical protein